MTKHFLTLENIDPSELVSLLDEAARLKKDPSSSGDALSGRHVALLFEKQSTRTRVSFDVAVGALGGRSLILNSNELQLDRGETIEDTARTLACYVQAVVLRTFGHDRIVRFASASSVPVINALTDYTHPCQGLTDLFTIREALGALDGVRLAYLGDGNNVAHSLLWGAARCGMDLRIAGPASRWPSADVVSRAKAIAADTGATITVTESIEEAAASADVVYTDVWQSMGDDSDPDLRRAAMLPYQLNDDVVALAASGARVMHCLPAHRGEEITDEVIDGPRSIVWDQAANRIPVQQAILLWLLSD